jgi:uncharacterized protein
MISNATLLRRSLAIDLHRLGLRSVQVTLDGPPSIHDAARRTRHGTGTFQRILDNVANAQQATGLLFTIRINVTAAVLPDLGTLIQHLGTRLVTRRCRLQIAFLQNDHTFDNSVGLPPDVAAQVVGAYEFAAFLGFRTPWPTDNKCVFCAERNGRFGAVVNADGALFSSWESAGRSGLAVGSVEVGYRNDVPDRWRSCSSGHPGQQFTDAVDAGLLDLAWRRKRGQSCHR